MTASRKSYNFVLISFLLLMPLSSYFYTGCKNENHLSVSPVPASANQMKSEEDLITDLEKTETSREREIILKENKELLNYSLVIALMVRSTEFVDATTLSLERSRNLAQIAIEVAELTGDKISSAKAYLYYACFESIEKNDCNPSSLQKALILFQEAGDRKGEACCYYVQAKILHYGSFKERDKAFELLDKALNIFEEIDDKLLIGDSYFLRGGIYRDIGHKDKAIENLKKAIRIYEEQRDLMSILNSYQEMILVCHLEGYPKEALEYLELKRILITNLNPDELKDFSGKEDAYLFRSGEFTSKEQLMMDYYWYLGIIYSVLGKYEESIKSYKKVIELGEKLDKKNFLEITAYWTLGGLYLSLGRKETALKYYLESIERTDESASYLTVQNYLNLGDFYLNQLNKPEEAIKYYKVALEKSEEIEMTLMKDQYKAACIDSIGRVYEAKGDFDMAVEKQKEAIEILKEIYELHGQCGSSLTLSYAHIGNLYQKKGAEEKALDYINKALEVTQGTTGPLDISIAYKVLGDFYFEADKPAMALDFYSKGLKKAEEYNSPSLLWPYYFSLGKVYEKQDNLKEAYNAYNNSIKIIENMRQELKTEEIKRDFMQDKIKVYEHIIELLIKMNRLEDAFEYNEKARARAFLDILANQKVDIHHGLSPELIAKEEELQIRIQYLSSDIREEKSRSLPARRISFITETEEELKGLKLEYKEVLEEIKLESPEYLTFISVTPYSLKEIQGSLDNDTVIVEYFFAKDRTYLWVISIDSFDTIIIEKSREEIENTVKSYRESCCDNITIKKLNSNEWKDISEELYSILFKEVEKFIPGKKRLVIVPHRILHYLPFHTLMNEEEKTLIEKYEIVYLPSASVLKFCQDKNFLKKDKLLAFCLGDFTAGNFSPLPGTEGEVESVASYFPENEIYSEDNMKVEILQNKGRNFDLLHFATHGILDADSPLFSSLIFADRSLNVYEIFDLDLKADLVTLSACRTGLPEEANGDELVGLSRAFIYAGSPSICSSLWDVSDKSTAELMERFYFYLQDKNKSEALRLAQMDLMKKYSHPYFWAPFILIGDWK